MPVLPRDVLPGIVIKPAVSPDGLVEGCKADGPRGPGRPGVRGAISFLVPAWIVIGTSATLLFRHAPETAGPAPLHPPLAGDRGENGVATTPVHTRKIEKGGATAPEHARKAEKGGARSLDAALAELAAKEKKKQDAHRAADDAAARALARAAADTSDGPDAQDLALFSSRGRNGAGRSSRETGSDAFANLRGHSLNRGVIERLRRDFKPRKVRRRAIAAAGSRLLTGGRFDALLRKTRIGRAGAYTLGPRWTSRTWASLLPLLDKGLANQKPPELVRLCILPDDLLRGKYVQLPKREITAVVERVLDAGAIPVLFTPPVNPARLGNSADGGAYYNRQFLSLARRLRVPCVDAWTLINSSPRAAEYVSNSGYPSTAGYQAVNAAFLRLYRALETHVLNRGKPSDLPNDDLDAVAPDED